MYINDLPAEILTSKILMFADDVKIYRKVDSLDDMAHLQDDLNRICSWSKKWMLTLNPAKCKHFRMTLKRQPLSRTYDIDGTALEHVEEIRDLGVKLDQKLTFGPHVDICVKKANRSLGLLFRSFQKTNRKNRLNLSSVQVAYFAHVRSILEYGSVVWAGAAKTHLDRIERIQHKFLIWLNYHSGYANRSLDYNELLRRFNVTSLKSRRNQHDLLFLRNLFRGRVDSPDLLSRFSLSAPQRLGRRLQLFHVPFGRVDSVMNGLLTRLPRSMNAFAASCPGSDLFHDSLYRFRTSIVKYVCGV